MRKLSTGDKSTLGNWIKLSKMAFGETSAATLFLKEKAKKSPNGLNEEVIAEERQLLMVLRSMHNKGTSSAPKKILCEENTEETRCQEKRDLKQ